MFRNRECHLSAFVLKSFKTMPGHHHVVGKGMTTVSMSGLFYRCQRNSPAIKEKRYRIKSKGFFHNMVYSVLCSARHLHRFRS